MRPLDIVHADEVQWTGPQEHRRGGIMFRTLFVGKEGEPDNYWFTLVRIDEAYQTPAHRHNFDQVRFMLKGDFGTADQVQHEGEIGYFCEGTTYEQRAEGPSITLLLQTANASRSRYLSQDEVRRVNHELMKHGRFEDGEYITTINGIDVKQDGFEAAWEYATKEKIRYSEPRYDRPIMIRPDRFAYQPLPGHHGVQHKHLGSFSERTLDLGFYHLEAGGSLPLEGHVMGCILFYILTGSGRLDDGRDYAAGTALRLEPDMAGALFATEKSEIYYVVMPK